MKLKYYKEDDILVLRLSEEPIAYAMESDWIVTHFDEKDRIVRFEILDAKRFLKEQSKALPKEIKEAYFSLNSFRICFLTLEYL